MTDREIILKSRIAELEDQNRDMLEALIEVYSAWRHTDNVIDPEAPGYEILNKIKTVIERATVRKIEEVME